MGSVHILASQEPVSCRETQAWNVNAGSNSLYIAIYTLAIEEYTCTCTVFILIERKIITF